MIRNFRVLLIGSMLEQINVQLNTGPRICMRIEKILNFEEKLVFKEVLVQWIQNFYFLYKGKYNKSV